MDPSNWSHLGLCSLPVWQHRGADARVLTKGHVSQQHNVYEPLPGSFPSSCSVPPGRKSLKSIKKMRKGNQNLHPSAGWGSPARGSGYGRAFWAVAHVTPVLQVVKVSVFPRKPPA